MFQLWNTIIVACTITNFYCSHRESRLYIILLLFSNAGNDAHAQWMSQWMSFGKSRLCIDSTKCLSRRQWWCASSIFYQRTSIYTCSYNLIITRDHIPVTRLSKIYIYIYMAWVWAWVIACMWQSHDDQDGRLYIAKSLSSDTEAALVPVLL